jgi:hypothetical protein
MDISIEDMISLFTNLGFPVALCFILIRYLLQTIGEKLEKLDVSLNVLTEVIQDIKKNHQ